MSDRITISLLKTSDGLDVSLDRLTGTELSSFMATLTALRAIVEAYHAPQDLVFGIVQGSAVQYVQHREVGGFRAIKEDIDKVIAGESYDGDLISSVRKLHEEIGNSQFDYSFFVRSENTDIDYAPILRNMPVIKQRRHRTKTTLQLKILKGYLNDIGPQGSTPESFRYYLAQSLQAKQMVACTKEDVHDLKGLLLSDVTSLVLDKIPDNQSVGEKFDHVTIIAPRLEYSYREFITAYNSTSDLVSKLDIMHAKAEEMLEHDRSEGIGFIQALVRAFSNRNFHLSELKTVLILSKPFKDLVTIAKSRSELLELYKTLAGSYV